MYYLRTRAAADAIKFTVDQQSLQRNKALSGPTAVASKLNGLVGEMDREVQIAAMVCSLENKEACLACGS